MSEFIVPDWPAPPGVRALSTTRVGGVSRAPWAGFNLGDHVGDDPAAVRANRQRLRQALPDEPRWLTQVHGTRWLAMYLPVWLYSYHFKKEGKSMVHYIAVNGRTGEVMGSVPTSTGRLVGAAVTVGTVVEGIMIAILGAMK